MSSARDLDWPSSDRWPQPDQGGYIDSDPPLLADVTEWIAQVMDASSTDVVLRQILALKSWSMAARFRIGSTEVIYKCNLLDLYSNSGLIHAILVDSIPQSVPQLVGYRDEDGYSWTLFRWTPGISLEDSGQPNLLPVAAETLANIQLAFSGVANERLSRLSRYRETSRIPEMLETLIERIEEYYAERWAREGGARLKRRTSERIVPVPSDFADRLTSYLPSVRQWVRALADGKWHDTIVHVDLHPGNVIVEPNGGMRILDWDQAAIGFPFDAVMWLDSIAREDKWKTNALEARRSVKSAYLERLTWNTMQERLMAWDIYSRVGGIVSAYEAEVRNDALQRSQRDGGSVAMLLNNCLHEWERPDNFAV